MVVDVCKLLSEVVKNCHRLKHVGYGRIREIEKTGKRNSNNPYPGDKLIRILV